jgi:hypothetical protein
VDVSQISMSTLAGSVRGSVTRPTHDLSVPGQELLRSKAVMRIHLADAYQVTSILEPTVGGTAAGAPHHNSRGRASPPIAARNIAGTGGTGTATSSAGIAGRRHRRRWPRAG